MQAFFYYFSTLNCFTTFIGPHLRAVLRWHVYLICIHRQDLLTLHLLTCRCGALFGIFNPNTTYLPSFLFHPPEAGPKGPSGWRLNLPTSSANLLICSSLQPYICTRATSAHLIRLQIWLHLHIILLLGKFGTSSPATRGHAGPRVRVTRTCAHLLTCSTSAHQLPSFHICVP